MWRGERIAYGSPYGESLLNRLRRMFRGARRISERGAYVHRQGIQRVALDA